jgi:hypothetical protein
LANLIRACLVRPATTTRRRRGCHATRAGPGQSDHAQGGAGGGDRGRRDGFDEQSGGGNRQIDATFDTTAAPPGAYDVRVTVSDGLQLTEESSRVVDGVS